MNEELANFAFRELRNNASPTRKVRERPSSIAGFKDQNSGVMNGIASDEAGCFFQVLNGIFCPSYGSSHFESLDSTSSSLSVFPSRTSRWPL